jgi:hypothetical protein
MENVKTEIISCLKFSFSIGTHCQYQGVKKTADKMKGKNQIPKDENVPIYFLSRRTKAIKLLADRIKQLV